MPMLSKREKIKKRDVDNSPRDSDTTFLKMYCLIGLSLEMVPRNSFFNRRFNIIFIINFLCVLHQSLIILESF
jgi:hypothetical protein